MGRAKWRELGRPPRAPLRWNVSTLWHIWAAACMRIFVAICANTRANAWVYGAPIMELRLLRFHAHLPPRVRAKWRELGRPPRAPLRWNVSTLWHIWAATCMRIFGETVWKPI